jgi:hypothetical protein
VESLWEISALLFVDASQQNIAARIASRQADDSEKIQKAEAPSGSLLTLRYT